MQRGITIFVKWAEDNKNCRKIYKDKKAINNLVRYVLDKAIYIGGKGVPLHKGIEEIAKEFKWLKKEAGKTNERQCYHLIVSFRDVHDSEEVFRVIKKMTTKIFPQMQYVYGIHADSKKIHAHLIINSVTYADGFKKIHLSREEEKQLLNAIEDYCIECLGELIGT